MGILLAIIFLSGCATQARQTVHRTTADDVRAHNASNLLKLHIGMTRQDVLQVMGIGTIQTYLPYDYTPYRKIPNPYRTEIKKIGEKKFELLFYYTDIRKLDHAVTEDELTPIVLGGRKSNPFKRCHTLLHMPDPIYIYEPIRKYLSEMTAVYP